MMNSHSNNFPLRQPLAVWRAQLRSLRNMSRADTRLRLGLGISLAFGLALSVWSSSQLQGNIHRWQTEGPAAVTSGLWLLCLGIWGGMGIFTILGVQNALVSDESLLLLTQPLTPTARFRALYGSFFITNLWLLTLLQALVTGYSLLSSLGWQVIIWIALLQLGIVVVVGLVLVLTLLIMRDLMPGGHGKQRAIVIIVGSVSGLFVIAFHSSLVIGFHSILLWLSPEFALLLLFLLLMMLVGPGADISGKLYLETALTKQSRDRARKALTLPGMRQLSNLFSNRRGLTGALFSRSIINQGRNWLFWGRLVLSWGLLALFPLLRARLSHYDFSVTVLIAGYATLLSIGNILETAPGAISGEANRLALFLIAPFEFAHILRAKLALFLLPVLAEALAMGLFLCWWVGLDLNRIGYVMLLIPLIVLPCTVLLVWGSVWDENLNQSVEGLEDMLLLEEGPFSTRKMILINACLVCLTTCVLLLWRLPGVLALLALILLNAVIMVGMQRFGIAQLCGLLKRG